MRAMSVQQLNQKNKKNHHMQGKSLLQSNIRDNEKQQKNKKYC